LEWKKVGTQKKSPAGQTVPGENKNVKRKETEQWKKWMGVQRKGGGKRPDPWRRTKDR